MLNFLKVFSKRPFYENKQLFGEEGKGGAGKALAPRKNWIYANVLVPEYRIFFQILVLNLKKKRLLRIRTTI